MSQLNFNIDSALDIERPWWAERYRLQRAVKRSEAKQKGLCQRCLKVPAVIQRTHCRECLMSAIIRESFKFDRRGKMKGVAALRNSCYVEQFSARVRSQWVAAIKGSWTGRCYYSGLSIEIGSTAGLDHKLPVSRASSFGPAKVFHPQNLVWVDKRINQLKGDMTADEFYVWLRQDLPAALASVPQSLRSEA